MTDKTSDPDATLARYAGGPSQPEDALHGLEESDLNFSPTSTSWSVRQIVHHIVDGDDFWKICIKAALGDTEGRFSLEWYWNKPRNEEARITIGEIVELQSSHVDEHISEIKTLLRRGKII